MFYADPDPAIFGDASAVPGSGLKSDICLGVNISLFMTLYLQKLCLFWLITLILLKKMLNFTTLNPDSHIY